MPPPGQRLSKRERAASSSEKKQTAPSGAQSAITAFLSQPSASRRRTMLAAARTGEISRAQVLEAILCEMSRVTTLNSKIDFEIERRRSVLIHRYLRSALEVIDRTSSTGPVMQINMVWHVGPADLGDQVRLKP